MARQAAPPAQQRDTIFCQQARGHPGRARPRLPQERKNISRSPRSSSHHPRMVEVSCTEGVQTLSGG